MHRLAASKAIEWGDSGLGEPQNHPAHNKQKLHCSCVNQNGAARARPTTKKNPLRRIVEAIGIRLHCALWIPNQIDFVESIRTRALHCILNVSTPAILFCAISN